MVFIRDEDVDEVRERADIVEVVSTHVQLKKAGRLFKGLCPFHREKTPSFFVDPDKQLYHCFGCGAGGNIYTFIMKMENLDFPEAVKTLAKRIGYQLRYKETGEDKAYLSKQARLFKLNQLTQEFYQRILLDTPEGKKAREYLKGRGYDEDLIKTFLLGYAPDKRDALLKFALKQGYQREELLEAGLIIKSDRKPDQFFDRFRNRIIFPITDLQGRITGFGGRILGKDTPNAPKYMNSPETPIYRKGKILYGLSWAKNEIATSEEALVVEGYTDVMSLYQYGFKNAVATLGTALTVDHLRLLARFAKRVIFVFDADVAGKLAVERGLIFVPEFYLSAEYKPILDLVEKRHLDLLVALLPGGSDPADFVSTQGGEKFAEIIKKATLLIDFCISNVISSHDLSRVEQKKEAARKIIEIVAPLPSAVAQEEYLKKAAEKLGVTYDSLFVELQRKTRRRSKIRGQRVEEVVPTTVSLDPAQRVEEEALKAVLQFPQVASRFLFEVGEDHFTLPNHRRLFLVLRKELEGKGVLDEKELLDKIEDEETHRLATRLALSPVVSENPEKYLQEIFNKIKEFEIKRRINILKEELSRLNPEKEVERYDRLFENLLKLEAKRRELASQ